MRKEMIHILRDPRSLYIAVGIPILLIILFGYAITFNIKHIPISVIDLDSTSLSRELISILGSNEYFDIVHHSNNYSGVERILERGKARIVVVIPAHFSRDISRGKDVSLQLLLDGTDNNTALIALGYLSRIIYNFSSIISIKTPGGRNMQAAAQLPPVELRTRAWFNPALNSTFFIVPGLIAVVMMILASMLTSLTIAREWEVGTMEQLISTPVKPFEIIIGKLLPYFFLGIIQMILVVATGMLLFKIHIKGSLLLLITATFIFLICGLGIGLLISTIAKSQQLAFMFSVLSSLLPSFILSGFIFPVASMPRIIQLFTFLVPAKYFLVILRGIFLKGNTFHYHFFELIPLLIIGTVIFLACSIRLKLSLE